MQWYVSQNGRTAGPFTEERIAMLLNWGKISNDAYICDEKWSCWVSLTRSHFAPLLAGRVDPVRRDSQAPRAVSEPPAASGTSVGQRVVLALLIMLAAAAFLLALWLAPDAAAPGPMGWTSQERAPSAALRLPVPSPHTRAPSARRAAPSEPASSHPPVRG
jgi:GYF domain 2